MAGVNNVSTYDNASENFNNTEIEHTNKIDDSVDKDDSLQNIIENELSIRLDECKIPVDRVKYSMDIMLAAESIHSADIEKPDDIEYSDHKFLKSNDYQIEKDTSELLLLTEKRHVKETDDMGLCSEIILELNPIKSDNNTVVLSDNTSSGINDDITRELADQDPEFLELEEPRIFTRPLPIDELDNVTELVFDTWTTADDINVSEVNKIKTTENNGKLTLNISNAIPNQECCDINTPEITNNVLVSVCLIINIFSVRRIS